MARFSLRGWGKQKSQQSDWHNARRRSQRGGPLRIEQLESRTMLSISPSLVTANDVQLSIPNLTGPAGGMVAVPINISDADPVGSTGLASATIGITYDPAVFTVSDADVKLGSLDSAGWSIVPAVDPTTGQILLTLTAGTGQQITSTASGSLAVLNFHVNLGAAIGDSPIGVAASVQSGGSTIYTSLTDSSGQTLNLDPAPINGGGDSVAGAITVQPASSVITPVSLTGAVNRVGITADGATFSGGLDGAGNAFSAAQLGSSQTWNGIAFNIGAAGANNVVQAAGQAVALPAGKFSQLDLLATGLMGNQRHQVFTITYSDGATTSVTQSVSDWYQSQGYVGESVASITAYRNTSTGAADNRSFNVYGYSFLLDSTKTLTSITLPNNGNVDVLAITAIGTVAAPTALTATASSSNQVILSWIDPASTVTGYNVYRGTSTGGEFGPALNSAPLPPSATSYQDSSVLAGNTYFYVVQTLNGPATSLPSNEAHATTTASGNGTQVDLSGDFNVKAISSDGITFSGGLDGVGDALSANRLGSSLTWNSVSFRLGSPGAYDVVSSAGQTFALPAGQFSKLEFLATAVQGDQLNQNFSVNYTDGTSTLRSQSISDWYTPQAFLGESVAAATPYRDTWLGGTDNRTFNVYAYSIALNSAKTVSSITLPNNTDVKILAITALTATSSVAAPTGLTATAFSPTQINLSWNAPGGSVTGYNVYRGTAGGNESSTPLNGTPLPSAASGYQDASAVAGNTYYYVVKALNGNAVSQSSGEATATTTSAIAITPVNLSGAFNRVGITADAATFSGGLDGAGHALSATQLGSIHTWNNVNFNIGPVGANNVVRAAGQAIALPAAQFSQLDLLATGVMGNQPNQTFTVAYSDGTTTSVTQSISDWYSPQGYPGESVAITTPYRNTSSGGTDNRSFSVYGYSIPLDDGKTLSSITLPNDANVEVLAITTIGSVAAPTALTATVSAPNQVSLSWTDPSGTVTGYNIFRGTSSGGQSTTPLNSTPLAPAATTYLDSSVLAGNSYFYVIQALNGPARGPRSNEATATLAASGTVTSVDLMSAFSVKGITADGARFADGLDGVGDALSAARLGSSLTWDNVSFSFGTAGANNGVSAAAQAITLPAGQFSKLDFLATSVQGSQLNQAFTVHYTDGTSTSVNQSMSDWYTPQSYPGESVAIVTPYRNTWTGNTDNRTFNVYGYTVNLDSSKTVSNITLPSDSNVNILAMAVVD